MKKIDGEIKTKVVTETYEVGAKWIADDGTEFDNQEACEKYEAEFEKRKRQEEANKLADKILHDKNNIHLENAEFSIFLKKYNTKEELEYDVRLLRDLKYTYSYIEGCLGPKVLENVQFPAWYFIYYEGDGDYNDYNFLNVDAYKNNILKDFEILEKAVKEREALEKGE